MKFDTISAYIDHIVDTNREIVLHDFVKELHDQFYDEIDIECMDDFLEIDKEENEGQFVVHHQKLIDYGVATSGRSANIKDRLKSLGLEQDTDYRLLDVQQPVKQGGYINKKLYMLTPEAFFLALQRAQRRKNQTKDPAIYAKYFQFLQKVVKYYDKYQIKRIDKISTSRLTCINDLNTKMDRMNELAEESKLRDAEQNVKIDKLLAFGKKASEDNDDLKIELSQLNITAQLTEQKLTVVSKQLEAKSYTSTKNPQDKKDVHHVLVMCKEDKDGHHFKMISGQLKYVKGRKTLFLKSKYKVAFDIFYNANGIDFRTNVCDRLNKYIDRCIQNSDDRNASKIIRKTIKISRIDITWKPNHYISLTDVLDIMKAINIETQTPPRLV